MKQRRSTEMDAILAIVFWCGGFTKKQIQATPHPVRCQTHSSQACKQMQFHMYLHATRFFIIFDARGASHSPFFPHTTSYLFATKLTCSLLHMLPRDALLFARGRPGWRTKCRFGAAPYKLWEIRGMLLLLNQEKCACGFTNTVIAPEGFCGYIFN